MYILGHVETATRSEVVRSVDLRAGERVLELMLPDILNCHDWAYEHSWYRHESARDQLIVTHMVGDAVVHYGTRWSGERRRRGWAYVRMGQVARRYETFWTTAEQAGWRRPDAGERDSRRGWAHSLVEYSIDQLLADTGDWTEVFEACRDGARATLRDPDWVDTYVHQHTIPDSSLSRTFPGLYLGAVSRARQPDEIHLRGLALKFGLVETDEVLDWLRTWMRDIVSGIGREEMERALASITEVVAEPDAYAYPTSLKAAARIPDPAGVL